MKDIAQFCNPSIKKAFILILLPLNFSKSPFICIKMTPFTTRWHSTKNNRPNPFVRPNIPAQHPETIPMNDLILSIFNSLYFIAWKSHTSFASTTVLSSLGDGPPGPTGPWGVIFAIGSIILSIVLSRANSVSKLLLTSVALCFPFYYEVRIFVFRSFVDLFPKIFI